MSESEDADVDYSQFPFKPASLVRKAFRAKREAWAKLRPLLKPFRVGPREFVADRMIQAAVLALAGTEIEPVYREPAKPQASTDMLTIREAIDRYSISDSTIRRRIRDGKLIAKQVAGEWRILARDIEAAINRGDL